MELNKYLKYKIITKSFMPKTRKKKRKEKKIN